MFEFDPATSDANRIKHGIDFVEAQALWNDDDRTALRVVDYDGETRHLFVGTIAGRRSTAVVTRRDSHVRIISVRRSRPSEAMAYDRCRIRPDVR
jgi:uncharacterized DUF497 family protein